MKTSAILAGIASQQSTALTQTIHALEKDQWLQSLTAGQILKGRIMRQHSEHQYAITLAGQERVVDSAIPLTVGDLIEGKVIGVSERTVSIRMTHHLLAKPAERSTPAPEVASSQPSSLLKNEMLRWRIALTDTQFQLVHNSMQGLSEPLLAIRAGLYLAKLGVPLTAELIQAVYKRLLDSQMPGGGRFTLVEYLPDNAAPISSDTEVNANALYTGIIKVLAEHLEQQFQLQMNQAKLLRASAGNLPLMDQVAPETNMSQQFEDGEDGGDNDLISLLMNVQTGASVQHRLHTLPIMIDGHIREFDLALFDDASEAERQNGMKCRHLRFCLHTELGEVQVDANVVNQQATLKFQATSAMMAGELEQHGEALASEMHDAGWHLEHADYELISKLSRPASAIVEHVLTQDSLYRLL
ncbi:flagellar hook-length control protein FliK [Pseudomethylobacillus aquaticus]|uniref:Flagellar hook-length control protein FliK n=1 Tax=Pseudomethylobacillus aquaticus TaxID=2676064 RepID=A0A3N0UZG2_9PROT|nr:flagellar hook-length control protein FliK [Pseudomethylobacillus aquaticus]ROH85893.1 flagellar hook-length control protein FliK [Pseudomethylobacillus aquaticus]